MNQNQIIIGAINNLIDESKKILIPNAIATLSANLNEACEYKDFFLINYEKYANQIIENSKLPLGKKEEIRQKFKNPLHQTNTLITKPIGHTNDKYAPELLLQTMLLIMMICNKILQYIVKQYIVEHVNNQLKKKIFYIIQDIHIIMNVLNA